jgi:hypothetical protein
MVYEMRGGPPIAAMFGNIVRDLHITSAQVGWIPNITLVSILMSVCVTSALGDRIGHRTV